MSFISHINYQRPLQIFSAFCNQSSNKQNLKIILSVTTVAIAIFSAYDLILCCKGKRSLSTESEKMLPLQKNGCKVSVGLAKVALVVSGLTSTIGLTYLLSPICRYTFSAQSLTVFGPNINFAGNPWHPRHLISFAPYVLSLPILIQKSCQLGNWAWKKMNSSKKDIPFYPDLSEPITVQARPRMNKNVNNRWFTDQKVFVCLLGVLIISRPGQHAGNAIVRTLLNR